MSEDKQILRWDKFVFYSSLFALVFLACTSWYRKKVVLPKEKEIIESRSYQTIKTLEKENEMLQKKIDSLELIIENENK